jgi:hypothetical protein
MTSDKQDPAELARLIFDALDAPEDPVRRAQLDEHERRNEELLEVFYVRSGQRPPVARTLAEIELATELAPCPSCGERALGDLSVEGEDTSWTAEARCARCGARAGLAYTTRSDPTKVAQAAFELGPGPSLQIRAESFEAELARVLPAADGGTAAWRRALVCVNELIKLTRSGPVLDALQQQRAALMAKSPA